MGGVIGGATNFLFGGDGASKQADAANGANAGLQSMFNTVNSQAQPYMQAGSNAIGQLDSNMGHFNQPFTMSQFQQSPGYQFSLQQGQQGIQNAGAAQGGLVSGAQMAALNNYSQNMANNEYQNAFNNYTTQTQNSYNNLMGVSQLGAGMNSSMASAGMGMANQMGQNSMGAANAYAAQQQSQTNMFGSLAGLGMVGAMGGFGKGK